MFAGAIFLGACGGQPAPTTTAPSTSTTTTAPSRSSSSTISVHATAPQVGGAADWLMYGRSGARTGVGPAQPTLSASAVRVAWTGDMLDGEIYAQPLVDEGRVVAATEGGTLYGLDLRTGHQLWQTHLADPATTVMPCGNIQPLGITGTPAIDPSTHIVYAVGERTDGSHLLGAVDDRSGDLRWARVVDPPGMIPANQQQRAALIVANGHVYVAFGGLLGDCATYHGWVVGVALDGQGDLLDYRVPSGNKAGIWAASGIAVGDDGSLYVADGNSVSQSDYDHGEALIRLDPALHELGFTAPDDWAFLNAHDLDVGSTGPILLPGGLAAVGAKDSKLHVSAIAHLGGVGTEAAADPVCDTRAGAFGGMAASDRRLYVPCSDTLVAADVDPAGHATVVWRGRALRPPILAYGAVWGMDLLGTDTLHAIDPASGRVLASVVVGPTQNFVTPSAVAGFVLVGAKSRVVAVAAS